MPRKAKEEKSEIEVKQVSKVAPKTTKTEKKTSTKVSATTTNKVTAKKTATKSAKNSNIIKKVVDSITPKKKNTTKKSSAKTTTTNTKKSLKTLTKDSIKSTEKNEVAKKPTTISGEEFSIAEYYDLPYRYNQTVIKLLAQTPTTLFIYWDISDKDRKTFEEQYGENFFNETRPVLIVHNDTLNYSFEVEINDFANSWYLHVADSKCDYRIELGRRPIIKKDKLEHTDYIYVTTSNELEAPNDRILLNKEQKMVYFRNVKTGATQEKQFASLSFMRNMGKIYNIYDLYKTIYKNENVEDIYDLTNPSSHPSS